MPRLTTAQREALGRLQKPGYFLKVQEFSDGGTRVYFRERTGERVEFHGPLTTTKTFDVLRRLGVIEPEPQSNRVRWVISDYGRRIMREQYQARIAAESPDVEYTDQHGGY